MVSYPRFEKTHQRRSASIQGARPILRMISDTSIHFTIGPELSCRYSNFHARAYNLPTDLIVMGQHFAIFHTDFILQPGLPSLVLHLPANCDAGVT